MGLHYIIDLYSQPEAQGKPVLWKAMKIAAEDDAEAIREAHCTFKSHVREIASLSGFSLRRVGFRRAGDRLIHQYATNPSGA